MKGIIIILLFCLAFSCTYKENRLNNPLITINLNKLDKPNSLPSLDEIAVNVEYIQLETDSLNLVAKFNGMEYTKDYLFIKSSHDLFMFDRGTGKFVQKIGSKGKGPGEYLGFKTYEIDEQNQNIYLWDYFKKQFLIYDFQGNFISAFEIKGLGID